MPQIKEYLPEVEAQGPIGQTSPMLEQVAMYGRGIEDAGRSLEDAGTVLRQRQTMSETSDAAASVAEQRQAYMERIQQSTDNGTLDDKGLDKIKQDYQDWTEKQYDKYDTAGGKDAFVRASARTGGAILQHAAIGSAVVAGNKAKNDASVMVNSFSNVLMNDPSQFTDLHSQSVEYVKSQVDSGAVKPEIATQIQSAFNKELVKGAVRGYMANDYASIKNAVQSSGDKVDPDDPRFNVAKKALSAGAFDEFIDADTRHGLEQEIKSNQNSAQSAGKLAINKQVELQTARRDAFVGMAHEKILSGEYSPEDGNKAAMSGTISPEDKRALDKLAIAQADKSIGANPAAYADLKMRILSPEGTPGHISDLMQLSKAVATNKSQTNYAGSKYINKEQYNDLSLTFQGANAQNNLAASKLFDTAKGKIGNAPDAAFRLASFMNDAEQAKAAAVKENKPVSNLYNPDSNDSLYKNINKYVITPQEILQGKAKNITDSSKFDASKYDLKTITQVDQNQLTPAQRNALRDRYKELKAGGR